MELKLFCKHFIKSELTLSVSLTIIDIVALLIMFTSYKLKGVILLFDMCELVTKEYSYTCAIIRIYYRYRFCDQSLSVFIWVLFDGFGIYSLDSLCCYIL